jgi:hypothetical protein
MALQLTPSLILSLMVLFHQQTRAKVAQSQTSPDVQCFNFDPGLWVAVCTDSIPRTFGLVRSSVSFERAQEQEEAEKNSTTGPSSIMEMSQDLLLALEVSVFDFE